VEALLRLGIGLHADGQFDEAERAVRSCLATIEKTHPRGTEPISTWAVLAELAAHEDRRGNWKEANAYYRRALELARRTPDADSYVAITAAQLASGLMNLGQVDNAEPLVQESLDIRRRLYTEESVPFAQALTVMTQVHLARGRLAEAEGTARKALAAYRKFAGEDSRFTIGAASYLALTLGRQERWPECAAVQRTILEWRERHSGPRDLRTAVEQVRMAEILFVLGEGARAEALLSTAVETFDAHVSDRVGLEMALTMLADHYDATGKPDEARAARDRLRALGPSAIPTDPVPAAAPASPGGAPPGPPGRDGLRR
jgi:tetratricopeptide (TPR) repeat protein